MGDSLHFCANRSVEAGFRCKPANEEERQQETEYDDEQLFDAEFARMNNEIRATSHLTQEFERVHGQNNSKYSLVIQAKANHGDTTFCDQMLKHLADDAIKARMIKKLFTFFKSEEYETDTLKLDIAFDGNGNIALHLDDKQCIQSIAQFIKATAAKEATFSLGFRFYYWPYYKERDALPSEEQDIDNTHDHSGHRVRELHIERKYASMKEE